MFFKLMSLIQSYIGYAAGHFKETHLTIHNLSQSHSVLNDYNECLGVSVSDCRSSGHWFDCP